MSEGSRAICKCGKLVAEYAIQRGPENGGENMSEPTMEELIEKRKDYLISALIDDLHSLDKSKNAEEMRLFRQAIFGDLRSIIKAIEDGL